AVFYGEMAKALQTISDTDWAFYKYRDEIFEQIYAVMEREGLNRSDLAKKLGKSRSFITQIFSGKSNVTMKTLCEILYALDVKPETRLVGKDIDVMWVVHSVNRKDIVKDKVKQKAISTFSRFPSIFLNASIVDKDKNDLYCANEGAA
ncbi:MAG: XRE family transcriptional regulator, partial [Proteobacteria bacterium]|nr:XRE family transcriptional regulator [Pseudomonadota bacterium]